MQDAHDNIPTPGARAQIVYQPGDLIWIHKETLARDKKVLGTWFGPYKVTEYTSAPTPKGAAIVTYQTCKGATLSTKHFSDVGTCRPLSRSFPQIP